MSFAFDPSDRSVEAALRRIARAELAAALKALRQPGGPGPQAVHGLRKNTKKLRGLLRLVRPVFADYDAANLALRDGARHMAALRDAEVRLATLQRIAAAGGCDATAGADILTAEVEALRHPDRMAALCVRLSDDLAALRREARHWRLAAEGWDALAPGLRATWRAARRRHRAAASAHAAGGPTAPFHEWRKSVKHHWYQARLLEPIWPPMMAPQVAVANDLAEDLGLHNDIDLLILHMAAHPEPALAGLVAEGPFRRAADDLRQGLARQSLDRGARLFAESAPSLTRRWHGWWRLWRAEA